MPIRIPAHHAPSQMAPGQISIPSHPRGRFLLANPDLKEVKYQPGHAGSCGLCVLRRDPRCAAPAPCESRYGGSVYYALKD